MSSLFCENNENKGLRPWAALLLATVLMSAVVTVLLHDADGQPNPTRGLDHGVSRSYQHGKARMFVARVSSRVIVLGMNWFTIVTQKAPQ